MKITYRRCCGQFVTLTLMSYLLHGYLSCTLYPDTLLCSVSFLAVPWPEGVVLSSLLLTKRCKGTLVWIRKYPFPLHSTRKIWIPCLLRLLSPDWLPFVSDLWSLFWALIFWNHSGPKAFDSFCLAHFHPALRHCGVFAALLCIQALITECSFWFLFRLV